MKTKQKALSPIVATILLVVVSVVLVTITLSWGRGFTNKGLEGSNTILKETTNNYMIGSPKLNAQGVLSFKNISPGDKSITITGYKIISSSEDGNFNSILDIEDATILSGGTHVISIPAFPPEQKVTIQLITDENEYISVGSITNIPEEQQDIPEGEPELEPLTVAIFSPNDNTLNGYYIYNSYLDYNATITGGTGEYTCSWELKRHDMCLNFIDSEIITDCNFTKQIINTCSKFIVVLAVTNGEQEITDTITYDTSTAGLNKCSPCPI